MPHLTDVLLRQVFPGNSLLTGRKGGELREVLSAAYRRMTGGKDTGAAAQGKPSKIPPEDLYRWYYDTYTAAGLTPGRQGAKRNVNQNTPGQRYVFDTLYAEKVFLDYVTEWKRPPAEFLMHCAVAFKLAPETCDELLGRYGYLPLHVKNLHHAALYTVLRTCQKDEAASDGDHTQFQTLRTLYETICQQMNDPAPCARSVPDEERSAFSQSQTDAIRAYLFENENLTPENLITVISRHRETFNFLHSAIRREYFALLDLFQPLYYNERDWDGEEPDFSLYTFLDTFCCSLDRKHYNEVTRTLIEKKGRHPTREMMIVLWIYEFCFYAEQESFVTESFCREKKCPKELRECLVAGKKEWKLDWALARRTLSQNGAPCSKPLRSGWENTERPHTWELEEMREYINIQLKNLHWPPLNRKDTFDRVIMALSGLTVAEAGNGRLQIRWEAPREGGALAKKKDAARFLENRPCADTIRAVDNVPPPLVAITRVLEALQAAVPGSETSRTSAARILECKVYEML